jgi:hypothetical protein
MYEVYILNLGENIKTIETGPSYATCSDAYDEEEEDRNYLISDSLSFQI